MINFIKEKLKELEVDLLYDSNKSRIIVNDASFPNRIIKQMPFYTDIHSSVIKKFYDNYEGLSQVEKNVIEKQIFKAVETIALEHLVDLAELTREKRRIQRELERQKEKKDIDNLIETLDEQGYEFNDKGKILDLMINYKIALKNSKWLTQHDFKWNLFSNEMYIDGKQFSDKDYLDFKELFGRMLQMDKKENILTAAQAVAREKSYNPLTHFFTSGLWDGKKRLEEFLIKFLGAVDNALNREMTIKFFVGLVKRIFEPGCKWDNILIFVDETQGTGKSTLPERICEVLLPSSSGDTVYYKMDNSLDFSSKDIKEAISKSVIVNFDEAGTLNKSEAESIKSFVSSTQVRFRKAYDITNKNYLLQCVYIGSSNDPYILKDYSGPFERRYWLMICHGEKHPVSWWKEHLPDEEIKQVLYEAYHLYMTNPNMEVNTLSDERAAELEELQQGHKTSCIDPMSRILDEFLNAAFQIKIDKTTPTYRVVNEFQKFMTTPDDYLLAMKSMDIAYSIESLTLTQLMAVIKALKVDPRGHGAQWYGSQLRSRGWIAKKERINSSSNTVYYNPINLQNYELERSDI